MENLIKEITATGNNGAVLFKLGDNGRVTHISPIVQCNSVEELYNQLKDVRDAINQFLNDLVDKSIHKN